MNYAILDIETTGLSPRREKITELAIYIHDGEKIIDQFYTLFNPERLLPANITQLTGITDAMLADAPRFFEVAKDIVKITEGCTIVGHNVSFDYNFIQHEFRSLGYEYSRKTLDTLKLSRKLIPGFSSYSLGNLCNELGIDNQSAHRAAGDALATVKLFELLLEIDGKNGYSFSEISALPFKDLNPLLQKESIEKLPAKCGVYYFFNAHQELIYVGKSKNILSRVLTHLGNVKSQKAVEMRQQICDIHYSLCGSELVALLKESAEIKKHQPPFNRAQRRTSFNSGLYFSYDDSGYITFEVAKANKDDIPLTTFSSARAAKDHLAAYIDRYQLCQKLCGLYNTSGACFHYSIKLCNGACIGEESVADYNARAQKLIDSFEFKAQNFIVIDKGPAHKQRSVVMVENGKYCGFGFIDLDVFDGDLEELKNAIIPQQDNRDVQLIIKTYLKKHQVEQIIEFDSCM